MQKIAIAGFGVEGRALFQYLNQQAEVTIFDQKDIADVPPHVEVKIGPDVFGDMHGYDVVFRGSPAIRPDSLKTDAPISTLTKEFFDKCPAPIVGVTGTKGKGTTASFIYEMLKSSGINAHLVGNIGVPAITILPDIRSSDVVVYELSSYQLWDLTRSPHIAVLLMIEPEHLDVHKNVAEYVAAKSNIARWQKPEDVTVYLPTNQLTKQAALVGDGKKIPYTREPGAYEKDGMLIIDDQKICSKEELAIPGEHNVQNACAAITAAWQFTKDTTAIARALREFKGLDHRLKFVREFEGVQYYDDSIATTPGSAIAAINAFTAPKVLILGGSDKGADFSELGRELKKQQNHMHGVVVIGAMQQRLVKAMREAGFDQSKIVALQGKPSMDAIVSQAKELAKPGDVVILSPSCASFDMFKNYKDRGDQFIAAVKGL